MNNKLTVNLQLKGIQNSVSINAKCKIPTITLLSGEYSIKEKCINYNGEILCTDSPEYQEFNDAGCFTNVFFESLKIFLKTKEGMDAVKLFMFKGDVAKIDNEELFETEKNGDLSGVHNLAFTEYWDRTNSGGAFASTNTIYRKRCPKKGVSYVNWHTSSYKNSISELNSDDYYEDMHQYYMSLQIKVYINEFLSEQRALNWSDERLHYQICHTLGHEFFIHAYRKTIPAMIAWKNKNWVEYEAEISRDTGESGSIDHYDYAKFLIDGDHKKNRFSLMKSFRNSLRKIIKNEKTYNDVKNHHDEKYLNI